jgi:hypothetical protein
MDSALTVDFNGLFNNAIFELLKLIVLGSVAWSATYIVSALNKSRISFVYQIISLFAISFLLVLLCFACPVPENFWIARYGIALAIAGVTIYFAWIILRGFRTANILSAFRSTADGVGFTSSLKLAHNSIDFMGIGAHKLTTDPEFEAAVLRCAGVRATSTTIRLLLADPGHPVIGRSETANQVATNAYQQKLKDSLTNIARIARSSGASIEVRHYNASSVPKYPQFRLFFANGAICIFSWTVWNRNVGLDNPQLILQKGSTASQEKTLYSALYKYFEDTWEISNPVDLNLY